MNKVMLILVLNKVEKLDELLIEFKKSDVGGGTIFNSFGMAHELAHVECDTIFGSFRNMFVGDHADNKTVFMVVNQDKVDTVRSIVKEVLGDLNQENIGVLFGIPVLFSDGIRN